jgi:hypothetical protein
LVLKSLTRIDSTFLPLSAVDIRVDSRFNLWNDSRHAFSGALMRNDQHFSKPAGVDLAIGAALSIARPEYTNAHHLFVLAITRQTCRAA